jgi:hypothetical protein
MMILVIVLIGTWILNNATLAEPLVVPETCLFHLTGFDKTRPLSNVIGTTDQRILTTHRALPRTSDLLSNRKCYVLIVDSEYAPNNRMVEGKIHDAGTITIHYSKSINLFKNCCILI